MTLKLCQLLEYYVRNIFMEKSCRNYAPKSSPRFFLILVNNSKQLLHARNYFKNKRFWKQDYEKALKKLTLLFLSNPIYFDKQDHEKQKESETGDQSLIRL